MVLASKFSVVVGILLGGVESSPGFNNCLKYALQETTRMFLKVLKFCLLYICIEYIEAGYHGITMVEYLWPFRNRISLALLSTTPNVG